MDVIDKGGIENIRIGTAGALFICVARGPMSNASFDYLERLEAAHIAKHSKIFYLQIVERIDANKAATEISKTRGQQSLRRFGPHLFGAAVVIRPKGVLAAFARSFAIAFYMMSGTKVPNRVFAELSDGLSWMAALDKSSSASLATPDLFSAIERFLAADPIVDAQPLKRTGTI